jgi:hypothetical protein
MNNTIFCNAVSEKIRRRLGDDEIESIKTYLSGIRLASNTSIKLAFKYHLEQVVRVLKTRKSDVSNFNLREYQIYELGTNKEDNQNNNKKHSDSSDEKELLSAETAKLEALFLLEIAEVYDLSKAIAPKSKLKYNYLLLDSNNCSEISNDRDKFTWLIQEDYPVLEQGYINLHSKMRNIVMARLGRMTFANMHTDFTDDAIARNRFAFGFEEFTSQALINPEGTRFQFIEFLPEYDTNRGTTIVLSPFNMNRGWFRFRERFKMLDKLTMHITNLNTSIRVVVPAEPLSLAARHISGFITVITDEYDNPVIIVNGNRYLLTDGPWQYLISDYNSGQPLVDAEWNGIHNLLFTGEPDYFVAISPVSPIAPFDVPFTVTLMYPPRFTGVLELISEDDSDDDTAI